MRDRQLSERIRAHIDQLASYQRERAGPAMLVEAAAMLERDASLIAALRAELVQALNVAYASDVYWPDSAREVLND